MNTDIHHKKQVKYYILAIFLMLGILFSSVFWISKTALYALEGEGGESSTVTTASVNEALIGDINSQIDDQRKRIDELAARIDDYKENIKHARNETASLQNQIYILNNQIAKTNLDIMAKEEEAKTVELEIERVELEIGDSEADIETDKEQLSAFIRRLDIYDQKSYLSVLLSNNSFSEFFDQIKYLENIGEDLQKTLNRVQELVAKLEKQRDELGDKREQLSELLNKLEAERLTLQSQKGTKNLLVSETQNSERKFQRLVSDLKSEQSIANNAIAGLERQLRAELEKKGAGEKFNTFGDAILTWPTNVRVITAYFHDPDYPYRHLFEHSGLDLATPMGTPLKAAEAGYVARVSNGTRWYGNYVMIIHNNNLATLYAHMSSIAVVTDQYVAKGQTIGASGNSGFSSGPHLHFEVRSNGIPVNPLNYLP